MGGEEVGGSVKRAHGMGGEVGDRVELFGDAEALRAEFGEMSEAGKAGWKELTPNVEYLKFTMGPEGLKKHVVEDDIAMMEQFHASNIVDLE